VLELAEDFLRDYRINGRKSTDHAERRWRKHLEPFLGMARAADVSSSSIARYVDARMEEGAQPASINRELAALNRMFRLGYNSNPPKVQRLPAFPRPQESNVRTGFVDDVQFVRLTTAAHELWLRAMIEIAYTYGWRKRRVALKAPGAADRPDVPHHQARPRHDQES
jgi:site-specific recombinase XerD